MNDIVERLRETRAGRLTWQRMVRERREAADEIERLRRWKAEAIEVLDAWEAVWVAAGKPGPLGSSKAAGVRDAIQSVANQ